MSPQDRPTQPEGDKPEGLSKYLKRMKTVLRPRMSSKRESVAARPDTVASSSKPTATPTTPARNPIPKPTLLTDYSALQQEKARALFSKYGLTLEPGEWKSPADLQLTRVTKPIRMRVRRTCHRCETVFGPDKVCVNCQHPRCKKCPRDPRDPPAREQEPRLPNEYPPLPKTKIAEIRARERGETRVDPYLRFTGNPAAPFVKPSQSGGQDLIRKTVRQRECAKCAHVRCKKCPREPVNLEKYPDGYPGDADPPELLKPDRTYRKSRRRVHYICHVCETDLIPGASTCSKCGQAKCAETRRIPPKKVKKQPDPEVLRRVEERMASLTIAQ
ncbi:hypothetical protein N7470_008509 [Penicillium chermesinum]|nr:hypothetical protein N7470_008509 [Penicillium chermesinum]